MLYFAPGLVFLIFIGHFFSLVQRFDYGFSLYQLYFLFSPYIRLEEVMEGG